MNTKPLCGCLHHSQEYGNTAAMAEGVVEGLRGSGCEVDLFNTNEGRFDAAMFPQYDCVAFGSPDCYSYVAGGLKTFPDDHYILDVRKGIEGLKGKPYALFYSHGGGGKVQEEMLSLFQRVGTLVAEPVASRGWPRPQVLEQCRSLGKALAQAAAEQRADPSGSVDHAV